MSESPSARPRLQWLAWVERPPFQRFIVVLIVINAVVLGLETSATVRTAVGYWLELADVIIVAIFAVEVACRIALHGWRFFRDPWSVFDFVIVAIAVIPASGPFAVLRSLRILRVLRLVSMVPSMRAVVYALLQSLPGLGSIAALLLLVFYVSAVMATGLFGEAFPEWFGTLGASLYTLFQIMTLESWSMGIVRPIMAVYPLAWVFFVTFILVATFTMLNLFIAVVVNAMQNQHEAAQGISDRDALQAAHRERDQLLVELRAIRADIDALRGAIQERRAPSGQLDQPE